jgi:hypothetical protein
MFYSSTCVGLRYGHLKDSLEVFPGSMESTSSGHTATPSPLRVMVCRICLADPPTGLDQDIHHLAWSILLRHPIGSNAFQMVQEY